jgi:hypothetical protein
MDFQWSADEVACVKKLAERFEKNQIFVNLATKGQGGKLQFADPLELPAEKRGAILGVMGHAGLITNIRHAAGLPYMSFQISPEAVQAVRKIREQENRKEEPRDIVEQLQKTAKSNPIAAWVIIGFIVLVAIVAGANQLFELLDKFGIVQHPQPAASQPTSPAAEKEK